MTDLNENSNSCSWPLYYGDKNMVNGQYYNAFRPRAVTDLHPGYDKDVVKKTILEHEATFRNQVFKFSLPFHIPRGSLIGFLPE